MNTINLFTEDTDLNIVKSWLCNATDGQIYPFDRFVMRINCPQFRFDLIQEKWDEVIGNKHDYKVDDPALEGEAEALLKRLNEFIDDVNNHPETYFPTQEAFYDNRGQAYVCVRETPDIGKEIVCVMTRAEDAVRWVEEGKKKGGDIKDADWNKTHDAHEYSIWDLNAQNGWYAYRRKMY